MLGWKLCSFSCVGWRKYAITLYRIIEAFIKWLMEEYCIVKRMRLMASMTALCAYTEETKRQEDVLDADQV